MEKQKFIKLIKDILYASVIALFAILMVIFAHLYIDLFKTGFIYSHAQVIKICVIALATLFSVFALVFYRLSKEFLFKLVFLTIVLVTLFLITVYIFKITGFWNKIDTVDKLREYVNSFGEYAVLIFIFISFAQVVFLPIPSFITVGAGVLLFGPLKSAIYSSIGIISGSIVAFFFGRFFGYKAVKWLIGKDSLDKGLKTIKGKDKIVLIFMFLFPFFPDDVLCFVAGVTTVTPIFFILMIFVTRIISIFTSCYSINNSLIPYNTWWGILIWIVFFAITIILTLIIYKKGEQIENYFVNRKILRKKQAKLR